MNADIWSALILGIIQGLTEFLPVSSSGHLELGRTILGTSWDTSSNMMFTVTVHGATALATVVTFQKDIDALVVGLSQAIAILPGISRSGATISTSVLLGIDREQAARFSFLMVVPLILGKMAMDTLDLFSMSQTYQDQHLAPLLVGFVAAFITGLWACKLMLSLVKRAKLSGFAIYCLVLGTVAAAWTVLA
ncbi:MAG: undecaprenyl-diphosphate phosphatase [Flavobacteriia bacterium]|nr:undecaprenyl-diphosphate phosphatase [Flavobacteriia bacterium]